MNIQENKCIKKLWKLWYQFNQYFMVYEKRRPVSGRGLNSAGNRRFQNGSCRRAYIIVYNMKHSRKKYTNSTGDQWKEFLRGVLLIYLVRTEKQIMWSLHMSSLVFCPAICISITFSSILIIFNNYLGNICITIFIHNIFYPSESNLSSFHSALNHNKHKKR